MENTYRDQNGKMWTMRWGVLDPHHALEELSGPATYESTGKRTTFQDPLYANETKTLEIYRASDGETVAMAEITPGICAVGICERS